MCKELGLSWQNSETREWFPIARLTFQNKKYSFQYTKGALEANKLGFKGLAGFKDFNKIYHSDEIFPVFQNRIMNKSRPDREEFLSWLDLEKDESSQFEELARTGGIKATDSLQLYPVPFLDNDSYKVQFFVHGVSHLPDNYKDCTNNLKTGDKLFLASDLQNEQDQNALLLRTNDPIQLVGYCPKFFAKDFKILFDRSPNNFKVKVVKLNLDAPEQLRLLCEVTCNWPENFTPFDDNSFKVISN